MKWLGKWIKRQIRHANEHDEDITLNKYPLATAGGDRDWDRRNALNFQLHSAEGGFVLEYKTYDEKRDRYITQLYLITHEMDMADVLSKTITVELMRK